MSTRITAILAASLLAAACGDGFAPLEPLRAPPSIAAMHVSSAMVDHYIIVLRGAGPDVAAEASRLVPPRDGEVERIYRHALRGFVARVGPAKAIELRADHAVGLVEADQSVSTGTTQSPTPSWGLDRIDQRSGLDDSYTYNRTGAGVRLYGIDTGIRATHVDFGGRVTSGFTAINDGRGTTDCHGHGTHTASTAAGMTYGVAKGMTVVPVRVLNCQGSGTVSGVIAGIDWVTGHALLPAVANMSLGAGASSALDQAVANSVGAGVVYVVSAGNSGGNACNQSPAREPSALTVAATRSNDARADFSNYGPCVDLFAPGVGIRAASASTNTAVTTKSGTSMSAPHVTGVAGLYLEAFPNATPAEVAQAILSEATQGAVTFPGSGSPNRLLYMGFIGGGGANQPPTAAFTYSCIGTRCTFDGSPSTDDFGIVEYRWAASNRASQTGKIVSYAWDQPRMVDVTLSVRDAGGLTDSITKTFAVGGGGGGTTNQPPVADFTYTCAPAGHECTFDGTSSTDDQGIVSYTWTATNRSSQTGPFVTYRWDQSRMVTVTLVVADAAGLTSTIGKTIAVP